MLCIYKDSKHYTSVGFTFFIKKLFSILLLICTLGIADKLPTKPIIHLTESPDQTTYYSSAFDDPVKFEFKVLSWSAFLKKYQYGWRVVEGEWIREDIRASSSSSAPITRVFMPPSWRSSGGLIIVNKTLSAPPSKK